MEAKMSIVGAGPKPGKASHAESIPSAVEALPEAWRGGESAGRSRKDEIPSTMTRPVRSGGNVLSPFRGVNPKD